MVRKHLIVTFDIPRARSGDYRYRRVDNLLEAHSQGPVFRVFKQVRLLTTKTDPSMLSRMIYGIIPSSGALLIIHVARPYRFTLGKTNPNASRRHAVNHWLQVGAKSRALLMCYCNRKEGALGTREYEQKKAI